MSEIDFGLPAEPSGTCPRCGLTERPLWAWDDAGAVACASCLTRLFPGRDLVFAFRDARAVRASQIGLPGLVA